MGGGLKRLGVIGTMVWDTIHRERHRAPVEEWGGIAYALAGLDAALPADWEIVPLIKVGRDLVDRANGFLRCLARRAATARFIEVPQPNNRVTLRYSAADRRTEQLRGGVPPWRWVELGSLVRDLDAIYCNLISGFELDLETAIQLRRAFGGPIYADLHSLFLGVESDGTRVPRPLPRVAEWFGCFDAVQLNEDELALIGADPMAVAVRAFERGVRLLIVTLGPIGAVYFVQEPFHFLQPRFEPTRGPIRTARVPTDALTDVLDPTGCGDVFGAVLVGQLIRGAAVEAAIRTANALAGRNARYCGASDLQHHLRGEIVSR